MIIVFPVIPWGFLWQRPQQLASLVGKSGIPVLYLATYSDKSTKKKFLAEHGTAHVLEELTTNVFHLWCFTKRNIDVHEALPTKKQVEEIKEALLEVLEDLSTVHITFLVQHPGWHKTVEEVKLCFKGNSIYDLMDDHHAFGGINKECLRDEEDLMRESDAVLATSNLLYTRAKEHNSKTILHPNGVQFEHFNSAPDSTDTQLTEHKKVLGYFGAIKEWFDFQLIVDTSKAYPDHEIVIIGEPEDENGRDLLEPLENIKLTGRVSYNLLPQYLAQFDVCLIPFMITPLTEATNPVKFFEYLAAGKPVVSTALPELFPYEESCYIAHSKEEFVTLIEKALKEETSAYVEKRQQIARDNSWSTRVRALIELIESLSPPTTNAEARQLVRFIGDSYKKSLLHQRSGLLNEITRISEERDKMLNDKDSAWRTEVNRITEERDMIFQKQDAAWRRETERLVTERDELLAEKDRVWLKEANKRVNEVQDEYQKVVAELQKSLTQEQRNHRKELLNKSTYYQKKIDRMLVEKERVIQLMTSRCRELLKD